MDASSDSYELLINGQTRSLGEDSQCIGEVFASPRALISSIRTWRQIAARDSPATEGTKYGRDYQIVTKMYASIDKINQVKFVTNAFKSAFLRLEEPHQLSDLLATKEDMIYLIAVVFWDQLFKLESNHINLLRCLNCLRAANGYRQAILEWLRTVPSSYMAMVVAELHGILVQQFQKLKPGVVEELHHRVISINIENVCNFLQLLYFSNLQVQRIASESFNLKAIRQYFDIRGQYQLHVAKIKELNFVQRPFLLDFSCKYQLLQIQSAYQQKSSMQDGLQSLLHGTLDLDLNGNFSLEGLLYLYFEVNRKNLLDQSMEKLNRAKQNLKSPLRISFIGEEGADEGGVKKEYFQLITKQIFNPYLDMFIPTNHGRYHWFNGFSYEPPIRFEFVGMLLGLALYNNVQLDIHFPPVLYAKLLNCQNEDQIGMSIIEDLKEINPEVYRSLKSILNMKTSFQDLELYFNIELNSNFGEKIVEELTEEGSTIPVNESNKNEYCLFYADYLLNKHVGKQFSAFKKGFFRVVTGDIIYTIQPFELQKIICGSEKIDFVELEESAVYEGYTANSPIIRNFWKILKEAPLEDKKKFLTFVTGTDRVPVEGLKKVRMVVQKHANTALLPTAHTCFNVLELPDYPTLEQLEKSLRIIMDNNNGFGII